MRSTIVVDRRREKAPVARAIDRYQTCGGGIRLAHPQKPCKCMAQIVLIRADCGHTQQEMNTTTTMMDAAMRTETKVQAKMATMPSVMRGRVET